MAGRGKQETGPSLLEWLAAATGLLVIVALFVLLGLKAENGAKEPPLLDVRAVAVTGNAGGHVLEVKVVNRSGMTAAGVQIEGVLSGGGSAAETSAATVDYVPGHSERRAGLLFTEDPRGKQLKLRATGYQQP